MAMRFTEFLQRIRDEDTDEGKLANFMLMRSDRQFFVADTFSFLHPDSDTKENVRDRLQGTFPVWSNEEITVTRWMTENAPEQLETLFSIYDQFRVVGDKSWNDPRKEKPKKKYVEVDWNELRRRARKTYLRGENGRVTEVYVDDN